MADVEQPAPSGDEVLVKVVAASVNTADLDHLKGTPRISRLATGLGRPSNPRIGLDVAGRVEAVGSGVTGLRPGDAVWADLFGFGHGAFAEYVCAPERAFSPIPEGATFAEAAAVPHSGVLALQALTALGQIRKGTKVLVNGAGGCVGPFAVQIAKASGAVVTGVDHTVKLDLIRRAGADRVVDYTREDVSRLAPRFDLILDIAASRSPLRFRRILEPGGRYVLIARTMGGFLRTALLGLLTMASDRRVGVFGWTPNRRQDLDTLARLMEKGAITPLLDRSFPLEAAPEALRWHADGNARGKVVIEPAGTGR